MESIKAFVFKLKTATTSLWSSPSLSNAPAQQTHYLSEAGQIEALEADLTAGKKTYTAAIVEAYEFNQRYHDTLVDITCNLSRQRFEKKNTEQPQTMEDRYKNSKELMKQTRKFNKFAEGVVSKETLQNKSNVLSGACEQIQGERWTYSDKTCNFDNTLDSDRQAYVDGTGVSLNARLRGEKVDPQHRAWGTCHLETAQALSPIHDGWVNGDVVQDGQIIPINEDLTVAIELSGDNVKKQVAIKNKYFTQQEAMQHIVTSNEGTLQDHNGNTINTGKGIYIFVLDTEGNLFIHPDNTYVSENNEQKRVGHPAFTRGESVACAGELKIVNGKITEITNNSGHYCPKAYSLLRAATELNTRGVLGDQCVVEDYSAPWGKKGLEFNKANPSLSTIDDVAVPASNNAMDLSEKQNPLHLLQSLTETNLYLKTRAEETSFWGYCGKKYEARKLHFNSVLTALQSENNGEALKLIDEGIKAYDGTFSEGRYVTCLKNIRESLVNKDEMLTYPVVKERLIAYQTMYTAINNFAKASTAYHINYKGTGDNSKLQADVAEQNIRYLAKRKEFADVKKEFLSENSMLKAAYKNSVHY